MTLWSLDRVSFRLIVLEANTRKTAGLETIIEKVPAAADATLQGPAPTLTLTPNP